MRTWILLVIWGGILHDLVRPSLSSNVHCLTDPRCYLAQAVPIAAPNRHRRVCHGIVDAQAPAML